MSKNNQSRLLVWFLACSLVPMAAMAQTAGKISGRVTNAATGEPLPGANILVRDTPLGASADENGNFFILNVPPGTFVIQAQMIGFKTVRREEVRISVNRTVEANFRMESTVIEGEVVTVQADRIAIKKDQTNSIRNISSEDIKKLPAENISAVVAMQPGVVENHFRGGRRNEVVYMVDGVKVTEAFRHESSTIEVNPEAVEDIEVITGTFNAEYGDAMSGVVNIVTKEGGQKLNGTFSSQFGNYLTSHNDIFPGLSASEFSRIQDYKFNLSGPVFKDRLTFLLDGRIVKDLGHLNGVHYFNVDDFSDYSAEDPMEWHTEHTGDSSDVDMNWHNSLSVMGKLTYRPVKALKVSLSGNVNNSDGRSYSHTYRYNPYGVPKWDNESSLFTAHINHMLSQSAFYDLRLSYSGYKTGYYLYENPLDPGYVHDEYSRNNGFSTGGQDKGHTRRTEKTLNLKFDFSWQLNNAHFLKTGLDVSQIQLNQKYSSIRNEYNGTGNEYNFYMDPLTNERIYEYYKPYIYGDSSAYSDLYKHQPLKMTAYIQDKMEFSSMVVNIGMRLDGFDPDAVYPTNYRNPANQLHQAEASRYSDYPKAEIQYKVSPRLGLSYQLGKSALLHFSYGHFFQLPPLDYYYQNNNFFVFDPDFSSRMGNANLRAQKTIQYEVGLWQQLSSNMNLDVAVYSRDIYDLSTLTIFTTYNQRRYGVYSNLEYGSARGFEVKYEFRQDNLSAGINYTLGFTRGIANNPEMSFDRAGNSMDPVNKMIPMEWDQRHVFNTYVGYNARNYGATAMLYYFSGETYTWSPIAQSPIARINLFPNNQHRPSRYSMDLTAFYNVASLGRMKIRLNVIVYNLFDRLNEVGVNGNTGRAYQAIITEEERMSFRSLYHKIEDQYHNPANFSTPRVVKVGVGVTF
jgi:outer membrane receptor protein involved in Fe transport